MPLGPEAALAIGWIKALENRGGATWGQVAWNAEGHKVAKGKALMSSHDVPEIREIFAWLQMEEVQVTNTVARKETARGWRGELLIRNF